MNYPERLKLLDLEVIDQQYHPWGVIYWVKIDPSTTNNSRSQRTVSLVYVYPNCVQKVHTHPGYEEIIIGLEGETIHWSNDREIVLKEGCIGYIPSGGQHAIFNQTDKAAWFLSIVFANIYGIVDITQELEEINLEELAHAINLDVIADKFSQTIGLPVTLVDSKGKLITEPRNLPQFCLLCLSKGCGDCTLHSPHQPVEDTLIEIYHCRFGVYSVQLPIIIRNHILGYLGCGYGLLEAPESENVNFIERELIRKYFAADFLDAVSCHANLPFLNGNHLKTVAEALKLVSISLLNMMVHSVRERKMKEYELTLVREKERRTELEKALSEMRLKLLESQVNPHFLFNTLNTIAQTAFMEEATKAAELTYALARLLRSSFTFFESLITVEEEISYIKDYLFIQKTRFPDKFEVQIEIEHGVETVRIPFMSILIMVENAIIHGFKDITWKGLLTIKGSADVERRKAILEVSDNGVGVPLHVVKNFTNKTEMEIYPLKGFGLTNVYRRLRYFYGENFSLRIERLPDKGTRATIVVPFNGNGVGSHV